MITINAIYYPSSSLKKFPFFVILNKWGKFNLTKVLYFVTSVPIYFHQSYQSFKDILATYQHFNIQEYIGRFVQKTAETFNILKLLGLKNKDQGNIDLVLANTTLELQKLLYYTIPPSVLYLRVLAVDIYQGRS